MMDLMNADLGRCFLPARLPRWEFLARLLPQSGYNLGDAIWRLCGRFSFPLCGDEWRSSFVTSSSYLVRALDGENK